MVPVVSVSLADYHVSSDAALPASRHFSPLQLLHIVVSLIVLPTLTPAPKGLSFCCVCADIAVQMKRQQSSIPSTPMAHQRALQPSAHLMVVT